MRINADGIHYRELNEQVHAALGNGEKAVTLDNVRGQRYIGTGLGNGFKVIINGVPGNDLGAFVNGAEIRVNGNAQDGVGNTMNAGRITIHGDAGDVVGYSMRGGRIFLRGNVGYRAGIHMKAYQEYYPVIVIGGTAKDYLGEYMAGGMMVVLAMNSAGLSPVGRYVGTGMHGGVIYLRGIVEPHQLGSEVGTDAVNEADWADLSKTLTAYCEEFGLSLDDLRRDDFTKLTAKSSRPYGRIYAY